MGRISGLDLEIGVVELEKPIVLLSRKCPYPSAEALWVEMIAIKATTPAGSSKKPLFMISAERNAQLSV